MRNIYAAAVPLDELSMAFIVFTWVWEWIGFVVILVDFGYYMIKEHKCGANVFLNAELAVISETKSEV